MNQRNTIQPVRSNNSTKLAVPARHSHTTSVSSFNNASFTTQFYPTNRNPHGQVLAVVIIDYHEQPQILLVTIIQHKIHRVLLL